jgi:predicted peptidase
MPICGGGDVGLAGRFKNVPLWAFHGARDETVPPFRSRAMVAALQEAGGHPGYTEYPDVGHNSWAPAYADPAVLGWLLARKKPHVTKKGKS